MKHIFFAYPAGLTGAALLALRASMVLFLAAGTIRANSFSPEIAPLLGLVAIALSIGFGTRILAAGCAVACVLLIWPLGLSPELPLLERALDAVALTLMGPGGFSVDAIRFGRRTMRLPE